MDLVRDGQFLPSFGAATRQYRTPALGGHALTKTMRPSAFSFLGLISSLSRHTLNFQFLISNFQLFVIIAYFREKVKLRALNNCFCHCERNEVKRGNLVFKPKRERLLRLRRGGSSQ